MRSGDVTVVDLGQPVDNEAGFVRPTVVVSSQFVLDQHPQVVQVVPLTSTVRGWTSEVVVEPDTENGLSSDSAAQCQHVRSIAVRRVRETVGNVGPMTLAEVREVLADLLDL